MMYLSGAAKLFTCGVIISILGCDSTDPGSIAARLACYNHRFLIHAPLPPRSSSPSAFTGYSFHVLEAVIVFANEVLVCFIFPLHMGLHRWYHLLTTIIHEGKHNRGVLLRTSFT
jgi:hypothetical protein